MSKTGDSKEKSMSKVLKFINNYSTDWIQKAFADNTHLANHLQSKWDALSKSQDSSYEAMVKLMTSLDAENENKLMKYIDETFLKGGKIGKTGRGEEILRNLIDRNLVKEVEAGDAFHDEAVDAVQSGSEEACYYAIRNLFEQDFIKNPQGDHMEEIKEYLEENEGKYKESFSKGGSALMSKSARFPHAKGSEKNLQAMLKEIGDRNDLRHKALVDAYNRRLDYSDADLDGNVKLAKKYLAGEKGYKADAKSSGGSMATGGEVDKIGNPLTEKRDSGVAKAIGIYKGNTIYDKGEKTKDKYRFYMRDKARAGFNAGMITANGYSLENVKDDFDNPTNEMNGGGSMATGGEADKYKVVGGTSYHKETPDEVVRALETARNTGSRVKLYYGDVKTGRDWHEEYDTVGTVGRSTGEIKIPLLIKTGRSLGGGGILDHCIVKIKDTRTGHVIYQNPKYKAPVIEIVPSDMEGYSHNTMIDGELHGRHKTLRSAEMLKAKMMEKGGEAGVDINEGIDTAIHYLDSFEQFWKKPAYADKKAKDMMAQLNKLKSETNYHLQKSGLEDVADRIGKLYKDEKLPEDSLGSLAGALDSLNEVIDGAYGSGGSVKKSSSGDISWLITG
jgi:hypothetical protein